MTNVYDELTKLDEQYAELLKEYRESTDAERRNALNFQITQLSGVIAKTKLLYPTL